MMFSRSSEEVFSEALGELVDTEVVREKPISEESLSWRWRLPDDTPLEQRRQLLAGQRRHAVLDRWTEAPRGALAGKTPTEATAEEKLRIPLLASVLVLEQSTNDPEEIALFEQLRTKLEVPQADRINRDDVDLQAIPLVRVPRLESNGCNR